MDAIREERDLESFIGSNGIRKKGDNWLSCGNKRFVSERDNEGGAISWSLGTNKKVGNWVDGSIYIRDCYKTIHLEMGMHTYSDYLSRVNKIEGFITELTHMRNMLAPMFEVSKSIKAFKDEKKRLSKCRSSMLDV